MNLTWCQAFLIYYGAFQLTSLLSYLYHTHHDRGRTSETGLSHQETGRQSTEHLRSPRGQSEQEEESQTETLSSQRGVGEESGGAKEE